MIGRIPGTLAHLQSPPRTRVAIRAPRGRDLDAARALPGLAGARDEDYTHPLAWHLIAIDEPIATVTGEAETRAGALAGTPGDVVAHLLVFPDATDTAPPGRAHRLCRLTTHPARRHLASAMLTLAVEQFGDSLWVLPSTATGPAGLYIANGWVADHHPDLGPDPLTTVYIP